MPYSNFPKGPVKVPVSCAYLPIFGAWIRLNFIHTYMMYLHHIALRHHLVVGNGFSLPDSGHTLLYAQLKINTHDLSQSPQGESIINYGDIP